MRRIVERGATDARLTLLFVLVLLTAAAGCSLGDDEDDAAGTTATATDATETTPLPPSRVDVRLTLVASSSAREVYDRLAPMFSHTPAGEGVLVEVTYGNALDITQYVGFGLAADVVAPVSAGDLPGLIESEQVPRGWDADEFGGMVANSVVVFVVRRGNPKGIRSWKDLTRDDVRIVLADPEFSGIARWAALAAFASELERGGTRAEARRFLRQVLANVTLQGKSGRDSLTAFTRGNADVLLTSESEAIAAQRKGSRVEYVVPDETMLIESPISVTVGAPPEAKAFVEFLRSEPAQKVFAEEGHRPVLESALAGSDFPNPKSLARLRDLGSPRDVYIGFFGSSAALVPTLLLELGTPREQ
jgi:sulfate/thiosulfate transport system substrate-binding protein